MPRPPHGVKPRTAMGGASAPETIRALVELRFLPRTTTTGRSPPVHGGGRRRAAPIDIDALPADVLPLVSQALRGLASRRVDDRTDEARRLLAGQPRAYVAPWVDEADVVAGVVGPDPARRKPQALRGKPGRRGEQVGVTIGVR